MRMINPNGTPVKCHDEVLIGIRLITSELEHEVKLMKECVDLMRKSQETLRENQQAMNIVLTDLNSNIKHLKNNDSKNEQIYVTKLEFNPVKSAVYKTITAICFSTIGAILALIYKH